MPFEQAARNIVCDLGFPRDKRQAADQGQCRRIPGRMIQDPFRTVGGFGVAAGRERLIGPGSFARDI